MAGKRTTKNSAGIESYKVVGDQIVKNYVWSELGKFWPRGKIHPSAVNI
jgi:hypothetical protein